MDTYIVGNWKMNQSLEEVKFFFNELKNEVPQNGFHTWIAPQTLHLQMAKELAPSFIEIGAQNCSQFPNGAFTGETSLTSLGEMGVSFTLVGHSERRTLFNESLATISEKTAAALEAGLKVILCVGENLKQREEEETLSVVQQQISFLKDLGFHKNLLIAYEPVWAIGTGRTASSEQAQEVHKFIREFLTLIWSEDKSKMTPILYGGSVKPDNITELMSQNDINGALVGGASLKANQFKQLYQLKREN